MRKILVSAGLFMLALVGLPSTAAALTCPGVSGFNTYYTVDTASACVWGGGNIATNNDDFLNNWPNLATAPDDGIWGGIPAPAANPILTGSAWTNVEYTSSGGNGAVLDVHTNGTWTLTGALANTQYLIGLKQANNPDWAVFLVSGTSGTWNIDNAFTLSHIALYSRGTTSTGTSTSSGQAVVPEPASLLLLGTGLGSVAWRIRRRRQATA